MNEIIKKDLENILTANFIPWDMLQNKTILITGATGLIGFNIVNSLLYANKKKTLGIKVIAVIRDYTKAKNRFNDWDTDIGKSLEFIVGSMEDFPIIEEDIDYIIHGASETSSLGFVNHPVETIYTALKGTESVLELAKNKNVRGIIYLSSMEVYGHPQKGHKVTENEIGDLSSLKARNSYPISKIQCENLFCAYAMEYNVPATVIRLTQTFGPGVSYNDNRIFAYFGRCVEENEDIVLNTKGETERSYLYTADAVTAVLTVLLKGIPGRAYNAADEESYCSISDMAEKIAKKYNLKVCYNTTYDGDKGYPETIYMDLDTSRLQELGWKTMGERFKDNGVRGRGWCE